MWACYKVCIFIYVATVKDTATVFVTDDKYGILMQVRRYNNYYVKFNIIIYSYIFHCHYKNSHSQDVK